MDSVGSHLERAKILEIRDRLAAEGYRVQEEAPATGPLRYDLLAEKGGRRIAYEVKYVDHLRDSKDEVLRIRRAALEQGLDDLKLIIVRKPRQVSMHIDNLENALYEHAVRARLDWAGNLPAGTQVEDVHDVAVNSITINAKGTRVQGDGMITVEIGPGKEPDSFESFPLEYSIVLGHDMRIASVEKFQVDTSSFVQ